MNSLSFDIASTGFEKLPPAETPASIRAALKKAMVDAIRDIQNKTSPLTVPELKRLLFRCSAVLATTPEVRDFSRSTIYSNKLLAGRRLVALSHRTSLRNFHASNHCCWNRSLDLARRRETRLRNEFDVGVQYSLDGCHQE